MTKEELLRFRAEDFATRFQTLLETEWTMTYQIFAGYAVFAYAAGGAIQDSSWPWFWIVSVVLFCFAMFGIHLWMRHRLQQRLKEYRDLQVGYLRDLHKEIGVEERPFSEEHKKTRLYAYRSQMVVSALLAFFAIVYVVGMGMKKLSGGAPGAVPAAVTPAVQEPRHP